MGRRTRIVVPDWPHHVTQRIPRFGKWGHDSTIFCKDRLAAVAYAGYVNVGNLRGTAPHSHVLEYAVTLAQEWL
jgi:hypothetical protein